MKGWKLMINIIRSRMAMGERPARGAAASGRHRRREHPPGDRGRQASNADRAAPRGAVPRQFRPVLVAHV